MIRGRGSSHGGVVGGSLPAALVIYTGHWLGKLVGDLRDPGCPGVSVSHRGHAFPRGLACLGNGCSRAQGRRRLEPSLGEGTGMKPRPAASPEPTGATEATSSTKQPSAPWGPLRVSVTQTIWAWGRSSETLLNSPPHLWERRKWELQKLGAGGRVGARQCRQSPQLPEGGNVSQIILGRPATRRGLRVGLVLLGASG